MQPLANELHERFAIAYAALEVASPQQPGNGKRAYLAANPSASEKTAENQASTLVRIPEVAARIEQILLSENPAEHIVRSGSWIDTLLFEAADTARRQQDAGAMARIVELADRGRLGGPKLVKETRSRKMETPFAGKSTEEILAMKREAIDEFIRQDVSLVRERLEAYEAERKPVQPDGAGAIDREREPLH